MITHDVLPYEIVGGVPAKHIGFRFEQDTIEKLEKLQWWNFSDDIITQNIELFSPFIDVQSDKKVMKKLEALCRLGGK